jgi:copper resistance protein C
MVAAAESAAASPRAPEARRPYRARRSSPWTLLAAATLIVLASSAPARAHARLERSVPQNGATVAPPKTIELWFNELLDDEFNDVAVYRATRDGTPADTTNRATAKPQVDASDRTHLSTPVGATTTGSYVVQYKVLSRDGHSARGRVVFRIGEFD